MTPWGGRDRVFGMDQPSQASDYRHLLLQFIGSLTLCQHMGDVSNGVYNVLQQLGMDDLDDDCEDGYTKLRCCLHQRGITTLVGTSLVDDGECTS